MISARDFVGLPNDADAAFVQLEEKIREELQQLEMVNNTIPEIIYSRYMNGVISAASALGLHFLDHCKDLKTASELSDKYPDVALIVDRFIIEHRIGVAKRERDFAVSLDAPTKAKIRHFITQIKEIIDKLDLPPHKKDEIYKKVAALELEINRARTQLQIAMDATLAVADTAGAVGKKLNPLRKLFGNINALLSRAKEAENQASLPPPQARLPLPDSVEAI
jgi:hypothetical protein